MTKMRQRDFVKKYLAKMEDQFVHAINRELIPQDWDEIYFKEAIREYAERSTQEHGELPGGSQLQVRHVVLNYVR